MNKSGDAYGVMVRNDGMRSSEHIPPIPITGSEVGPDAASTSHASAQGRNGEEVK